jgi:hypothetical protein
VLAQANTVNSFFTNLSQRVAFYQRFHHDVLERI